MSGVRAKRIGSWAFAADERAKKAAKATADAAVRVRITMLHRLGRPRLSGAKRKACRVRGWRVHANVTPFSSCVLSLAGESSRCKGEYAPAVTKEKWVAR